jgi:uncharacterized tellurite resistance protein B-like protein
MNSEEKVGYLANICYVLISDGAVDRIEEKTFRDIARGVGAGYFEEKAAMELARKPGYQVQLVGRWSQRIGNLEDMLFAAYCNGVLEKTEKKAIQQYAVQVGISQAQFDVIKEETKRRYAEHRGKAG